MEVGDVFGIAVSFYSGDVSVLSFADIFVFYYFVKSTLFPSVFDAPVELCFHALLLVLLVGGTVLVRSLFAVLALLFFK